MSDGIIYIGNTNVIELRALTNSVTNVVDTGATVAVTLLDASGTEVAGETWPVSASHSSGGNYQATLSAGIAITNLNRYTAKIAVTGFGGETGLYECQVIAQVRECE